MMIKICTLNVLGLNNIQKVEMLFFLLVSKKIDIICLQETFLEKDKNEEVAEKWRKISNGLAFFGPTDIPRSQGVAILLGEEMSLNPNRNFEILIPRRAISLEILLKDQYIRIINVYAPCEHADRPSFFQNLSDKIKSRTPTILAGDFNCVEDATKDRLGPGINKSIEVGREDLLNLTHFLKIKDHYREIFEGPGPQYSWHGTRKTRQGQEKVASRIDRIYIPQNRISGATTEIEKVDVSPFKIDHSLVSTVFSPNIEKEQFGKGFFKLNTSVLGDHEYVNIIKKLIENVKRNKPQYENIHVLWDDLKLKISHKSNIYCKQKSKNENSIFNQARQNLNIEINKPIPNKDVIENLENTLSKEAKTRA